MAVELFVPEQSPVTDRQALLMQRPWLDWCREVTGAVKNAELTSSGGTALNFPYQFSATITAPPNVQQLRFNSTHPYTSVTRLYASYESNTRTDVRNFLLRISVGSRLFVQQNDNHANYGDFTLTAAPIDHGTYAELSVSVVQSGGSAIKNNAPVSMVVVAGVGPWTDVPFNAANFGATGGTWTVTASNVSRFSYRVDGKTAFIQLFLDGSSVGGTPSSLNLVMPFTIRAWQSGPIYYYTHPDFGWGVYQQPSEDQYLRLYRDIFSTPFPAAANTVAVRVSLTVQIL